MNGYNRINEMLPPQTMGACKRRVRIQTSPATWFSPAQYRWENTNKCLPPQQRNGETPCPEGCRCERKTIKIRKRRLVSIFPIRYEYYWVNRYEFYCTPIGLAY